MPARKDQRTWLSAYIYFNGSIYGPPCDRLICEVVAPFVDHCREREWINQFFFIRYREYGPHVRLRLFGRTGALQQEVKPALSRHIEATLPNELRAAPRASASGDGEAQSPLQWIRYEPEFNRYGGKQGVQLAEKFFHGSSAAAIAMLQQLDDSETRADRLGKGLMAMLVLIYTFYPKREKVSAFAGRYAKNYLKRLIDAGGARDIALKTSFEEGYERNACTLATYVEVAWERLQNRNSLSATLDQYQVCCEEIREGFEELLENSMLMKGGHLLSDCDDSAILILPSYMHMMNNRLGIYWHEEAYLGHVLYRALANNVEPVLT